MGGVSTIGRKPNSNLGVCEMRGLEGLLVGILLGRLGWTLIDNIGGDRGCSKRAGDEAGLLVGILLGRLGWTLIEDMGGDGVC